MLRKEDEHVHLQVCLSAKFKLYPESLTTVSDALRCAICACMRGWHPSILRTREVVLNCPAWPPRPIYMVQNHLTPSWFLSPFSSFFCSGYEPDLLLCFTCPAVWAVSCRHLPPVKMFVVPCPALPCPASRRSSWRLLCTMLAGKRQAGSTACAASRPRTWTSAHPLRLLPPSTRTRNG